MSNNDSNNIQVLYFASLADKVGMDKEMLTVDSDDLIWIYQQLTDKYGFNLDRSRLAVAVNHHFVNWDYRIKSGDVVAFIPPVAGG